MEGKRENRDQAHETVLRRLNRETTTVTVSLTRADGVRVTRVGQGASHPQRIADAYAQLPPGEYVVDCVSTPSTVFSDVRVRDHMLSERPNARVRSQMYEGKRVVIA